MYVSMYVYMYVCMLYMCVYYLFFVLWNFALHVMVSRDTYTCMLISKLP